MKALLIRGVCLAAALLLPASGYVRAQAEDLLRLVSRDAAACLHIPKLNQSWQAFEQSELARRFRESSLFRRWQDSPDAARLRQLQTGLEQLHGKPIRRQLQELFGQEVVLAIYTRDVEEPRGVLLLKGESPQVVSSALDTWLTFDERKRERRSHRDVPYVRSEKSGPTDSVMFHVLLDDSLAIAQDEELIRQVIDLRLNDRADQTWQERPEFVQGLTRRTDSEVAAIYVNPRAWDPVLNAGASSAAKPGTTEFRAVWSRLNWLTLRLRQDRGLQLDLMADYDWQSAGKRWQNWVEVCERTALPLDRIPSEALLMAGSVFDTRGLSEAILAVVPDEQTLPNDVRQAYRVLEGLLLGLDPLRDVLPSLGPAFVACVIPRPSEEPVTFPADVMIALQLQRSAAESAQPGKAGLTAAFDNALLTGLNVAASIHNARTGKELSTVHQRTIGASVVHWAAPVAIFAPAYAVTAESLVLASSPEACELFLAEPPNTAVDAPEISTLKNRAQVLILSTAAMRDLLQKRRDWFVRQASRSHAPEKAAERIRELEQTLSLMDRLWLTTAVDRRTVTLSFGVDASPSSER